MLEELTKALMGTSRMGQEGLFLWALKMTKTLGGTKDAKRLVIEVESKKTNITFYTFIFQDGFESELSDVENFDKARPPARKRGNNISIFLRPAYSDNQVVRQNPLYNDQDETVL
jgi:hypothetical protein